MGFDPYQEWFGIEPSARLASGIPDHYRLLGIERYESDAQRIESAVEQRVAFLHRVASGKHSAASQQLLNEVARARLCLLDPAARASYDAQLHSLPENSNGGPAEPDCDDSRTAKVKSRPPQPVRGSDPVRPASKPAAAPRAKARRSPHNLSSSKRSSTWVSLVAAVGGGALALAVSGLVIFLVSPELLSLGSGQPQASGDLPESGLQAGAGGDLAQSGGGLAERDSGSAGQVNDAQDSGAFSSGSAGNRPGGKQNSVDAASDKNAAGSGSAVVGQGQDGGSENGSAVLPSSEVGLGTQLEFAKRLAAVKESGVPEDGLLLWLDASRAESMGLSGQRLAAWYDASGLGNNLVQRQEERRPGVVKEESLGGRPVVRFDAEQRHLLSMLPTGRFDLGTDFTLLLVAVGENVAVGQGQPNGSDQRGFVLRELNRMRYMKTPTDRYVEFELDEQPPEQWHVRVLQVRGGQPYWLDEQGQLAGEFRVGRDRDPAARAASRINVDSANVFELGRQINWTQSCFDGAIAEVLVYGRALSIEELMTLKKYLQAKWMQR